MDFANHPRAASGSNRDCAVTVLQDSRSELRSRRVVGFASSLDQRAGVLEVVRKGRTQHVGELTSERANERTNESKVKQKEACKRTQSHANYRKNKELRLKEKEKSPGASSARRRRLKVGGAAAAGL